MRNTLPLEKMMKHPLLLAVIATFAAGCANTEPVASRNRLNPQLTWSCGSSRSCRRHWRARCYGVYERPRCTRSPVQPAQTVVPVPQACKARLSDRRQGAMGWSAVPGRLQVPPAPLAHKAPLGTRVLKARASRVLLVRGGAPVPREYKA